MAIERYALGCPVWGFKDWVGTLYSRDARPPDFLRQYSRVFNAVEGNSTFYSLPEATTVERWAVDAAPGFRFCFKLPRHVTHELALASADAATRAFLERMRPLADHLGPFMIQLPASFSPASLQILERYLDALPPDLHFAVELRHPAFFGTSAAAQRAHGLLAERGHDRVVLDTRGLRAGPQGHPDVQAARHAKPDLPVETRATGRHPIVRFIGHPIHDVNDDWIDLWARQLHAWIGEGRHPYFFAHCPNDLHAPILARRLHAALLRARAGANGVGELPAFPGEIRERASGQLSLL